MNPKYVSLLRCPKTYEPLLLKKEKLVDGRVEKGILVSPSGHEYEIVNFIPRFVPMENYAAGFGMQWNEHSRTQYDETSQFDISSERFVNETKWGNNLTGQSILEVGSGSGRFTKEALKTGALVVSLDYSSAVEANHLSNGHHENVLIVQGSVYEMPFAKASFDNAFCFGVLQHTPDPQASFNSIVEYVKPGGRIATDVYLKNLTRWFLQPKYWVRPLTRGPKDPRKLYNKIKSYIDFMWPIARIIRKIPRIGPVLNWKLLISDYSREMPNASDKTLKEWAYLDSMDMLSPTYDYPQTVSTFRKWHETARLRNIDIQYGYTGIHARAVKPD